MNDEITADNGNKYNSEINGLNNGVIEPQHCSGNKKNTSIYTKKKENNMGGVGFPEIAVIFTIAVFIYGVLMTVDAIRRPANQFALGKKGVWISILILSNPIVSKFFGGLIWLVGVATFIITSISYHIFIRKKQPIDEKSNESRA